VLHIYIYIYDISRLRVNTEKSNIFFGKCPRLLLSVDSTAPNVKITITGSPDHLNCSVTLMYSQNTHTWPRAEDLCLNKKKICELVNDLDFVSRHTAFVIIKC